MLFVTASAVSAQRFVAEPESTVDSKNISAADSATFDGLRVSERSLAAAVHRHDQAENDTARNKAVRDIEDALRVVQQLHERCLSYGFVIAPDAKPTFAERLDALRAGETVREVEVQEPTSGRIFISASVHIRAVLESLPAWVCDIYRAEHDRTALSSFRKAMLDRDALALGEVAQRFPLCASSVTARVLASDLLLMSGEARQASHLLDGWSEIAAGIPSTVTADEFPEMPRIAFRRFTRLDVARRQVRLAIELNQPTRFVRWKSVLEESGHVVAQTAPVAAATESTLPKFDFDTAELSWASTPFDRKVFRFPRYNSSIEVQHSSIPTVFADEDLDWFAVNTPTRLLRFDARGGRTQQSHELVQARVKLSASNRKRYGQPQRFREFDPLLRLQPEIARVPGSEHLALVGSYVASASADDEYSGYQITASVPRRALICVSARRAGRVLWDTGSDKTRREDPLLHSLSFNTKPVAVGDCLYALGWQKVGTINAVLVCLDMATGVARWKTILVGNQIDLTMFGEISHEPFLGSLAVSDGYVYASTNLGVLAGVRAYDGEVRWITPYDSVRPQSQRSFAYSNSFRKQAWERNPIVVFQDRVIATPLDSTNAISVELATGRTLQTVPARRLGRYMLGLHGPHLVFCDRDSVMLVVARDLYHTFMSDLSLDSFVVARPALIDNGILYATADGLYCRRFEEATSPVELAKFEPQRHGTTEFIRPGNVVVMGKRVLVVNSDKVRCYEGKSTPAGRPK